MSHEARALAAGVVEAEPVGADVAGDHLDPAGDHLVERRPATEARRAGGRSSRS